MPCATSVPDAAPYMLAPLLNCCKVRTLLSQLEDIMGNLEDCCKSGGLNNSALLRGALLESIYKQRPLFKHIRAAIHAADQLELTLAEEQRLEQMQALVEECRTLAAKLEKLQKQMDDLQAEIAAGEAESSALGSLLQDLQQQTSQAEAQYEIVQKQAALDADAAAAAIIAASSELCHLVVDRVMKAAAFARLQAAQLAGEAPAHDKAPIAEQGWEVMTQKLSLIVSGSAAPKDAAAANWRDVLLAGYLQVCDNERKMLYLIILARSYYISSTT